MSVCRMIQGWKGGLLALGLALLLPAAGFAQPPDDAKAKTDKQIAELKAMIEKLAATAEDYERRAVNPEAEPGFINARAQMQEVKAKLQQLMKDRAGAEFSGYAQEAEKEVAQALLKELQIQLVQQPDKAKQAEADTLQAQLKRIEAMRQQKAAEVQDLEAKIRELSAKLKAGQSARPAAGEAKDQPLQLRFEYTSPQQQQGVEEITLRKVNGKWEVVNPKAKQADQPRRVNVVPDGSEAGRKRVIVKPIEIEMQVSPPTPAGRPASPGSRIDELEKKIDRALQQIEQMRRDMNRGRPGAALPSDGSPEAPKVLRVILDDLKLEDAPAPIINRIGVERK